jgi:predicted RNA-binding Zn-ribbon protein involved in translation (DUF1610 family)
MIWHLIRRALRYLWRAILFALIPPPEREVVKLVPIDANAPCPACGWRGAQLQCVVNQGAVMSHEKDTPKAEVIEQVAVRHCCGQCGAKWFEKTVYERMTGDKPQVTV